MRPKLPILMLYGCVIFLSSFLLFLIQPIFAKLILPWFGGSAAVWTTCLVFFQVALLAGYYYAFVLARRLPPRAQIAIHIALLAAALFLLPVIPGARWTPSGGTAPALRLLSLLTVVLGLPYFLLSTTGPLLQSWYARRWGEPYRFFALSNIGALLGLAVYPVLIEPRIATRAQDVAWSAGFAGFAVLCAILAWVSNVAANVTSRASNSEPEPNGPTPALADRIPWIALAAGGSMLLLATTNQLTQNVAAVPFLWIVPLAAYLLTFVLCFESSRWYRRGLFLRLLAVAFGSVGYAIYEINLNEALLVGIPLFTLVLFVGCMFCHGELSARRPPHEHLTSFYLMIALGGAIGAVLVGLAAPVVFSGIYDLPCALVSVSAIALWLNWRNGWSQRLLWSVVTIAMALVGAAQVMDSHANAIFMSRNFYGALRVVESGGLRTLYHGNVKHGSQFQSAARRNFPTTYYGPNSGAGLALRFCCNGPRRVGAIGLGAGTLSAYGRAGDQFRFYEINPRMIAIAHSEFSYLRDSPAHIDVVEGDARLSLDREPPQSFDVIAVDAFSGDAIPVHLLTREAFALYLRHLNPEGIIAVHVSNQFLDLRPVVGQLAADSGLSAVVIQSRKDPSADLAAATWVLATRNREFLSRPEIARTAQPVPIQAGLRMWTDDYNNLFQVLR
ncbi:MAG: spermidine synthase [Bryobacteraceae bacterium]